MDNITHSLIGITFGELWYQCGRSSNPIDAMPKPRWVSGLKRSTAIVASVVGNNLPDLDFLYASVGDPQLGYLLHHRGHTHTLIFGFILMLFSWLALKGFPRARSRGWGKCAEALLLLGVGVWLHVLLDSLNSYGVHPFWPLDNHWYHLDTFFILEPLAWVALIPAMVFSARRRFLRLFSATCFFGIVALMWGVPFVRWYSALTVTLVGLSVWYACQHKSRLRQYAISLSVFIGVLFIFFATSQWVNHNYRASFSAEQTDRKLADVILSPLPSNIFCWLLITVEKGSDGKSYYLRRGTAAAFPWLVTADQCPVFRSERGEAPLVEIKEKQPWRYRWTGEFVGNLTLLRDLETGHCQIREFLKFARAPFVASAGDHWLVGDLRFDSLTRMSFARFLFPKQGNHCTETSVPWIAPSRAW